MIARTTAVVEAGGMLGELACAPPLTLRQVRGDNRRFGGHLAERFARAVAVAHMGNFERLRFAAAQGVHVVRCVL